MRNVALVALVALASATLACGGVDEGSVDDVTEAEGELRTSGVKSIEVYRSTGFVPPPPRGQCRPSGHWEYDFTSQQLTGDACLNSVPVPVNNTLSDADHTRVRVALSKVRATKRPAACPTDVPSNSLTVKRAQSEARYVEQRAACGGGTPVKGEGLRALVELMEELSEPPPAR